MSKKVEITKDDKVLGHKFKKGETPNVSTSIYNALMKNKSAKDFKEAKKPKEE